MRRGATAYGWAVLVAVAAGCHHPARHAATPARAAATLPEAPRQTPAVDVPTAAAALPARPDTVRKLTAAECRTLAARNAPLADDLDRHPDNAAPCHPRLHPFRPSEDAAARSRAVRGYAADELRNRAAADALDDYYKLAQAEAQFDLLLAARKEVAARVADAEAAARHGARDRADALRPQLHDLDAQLAKLTGGIGALNAALRGRLALDPADPLPLGPADPPRVRGDDVDVPEAVRAALHYRPDLNLLRAAGGGDAGLTNQVLTGLNPLLAAAPVGPLAKLILKCKATGGGLGTALADRERQAEAEVRAAAALMAGHRAAAAARAAAVADAAARVDELEKRAAAGQSVAAELTAARLEWFKARGAVVEAAADWARAEVKLRQAMGGLVRE